MAEDLLLGTYYVVEVVPATGYRIAEEIYEVDVIGAEVYAIGEDGFVYDEPNCGFLNLEKFLNI